jgi:uncharacterized membrane protein YfcA
LHLLLMALLFLLVALVYSSVGFGGGSSYNALLVLSGMDFRAIPAISLSCNILVVSGGVYHFHRAGHFSWSDLLPFIVASVPLAWLGGNLLVSEKLFVGLLGMALLLTALQLMIRPERQQESRRRFHINPWLIGLPLGGGIGLLSGIVGIGGGIFLAPVLYLAGWGTPRRIAAMASGFILVNSLAGLAGQLMKQGAYSPVEQWQASWPLFLAVIAGGQVGSRLASRGLPDRWVRTITGLLVMYVSIRLLLRWLSLPGAI